MSNKDLKKLQNYRKEIKALDTELFSLLKKRIRISQKIMKYKREENLAVCDSKRETEIENQLFQKLSFLTNRKRVRLFIKALMRLNAKYPIAD